MVAVNALLFAVFVLVTISWTGAPVGAGFGAGGPVSGVAQPSRSDAAGALDAGAVVPSLSSGRGALPQAGDATGAMTVPVEHVAALRHLVAEWNRAADAEDDSGRHSAASQLVGHVEALLNLHEAGLLASGEAS